MRKGREVQTLEFPTFIDFFTILMKKGGLDPQDPLPPIPGSAPGSILYVGGRTLIFEHKKTTMKGLNKNWKTHNHIYLSCVKRPIRCSSCSSRLQVSSRGCCKKNITSMCGAYPDYSRYVLDTSSSTTSINMYVCMYVCMYVM